MCFPLRNYYLNKFFLVRINNWFFLTLLFCVSLLTATPVLSIILPCHYAVIFFPEIQFIKKWQKKIVDILPLIDN